jgi:ankyrin repeat protein
LLHLAKKKQEMMLLLASASLAGKDKGHVYVSTKDERFAIFKACETGDVATLKTYLDKEGYEADYAKQGYPLLHTAVENAQINMTEFLLKRGADVHAIDFIWKREAIHAASRLGYISLVSLLLDYGANVDARTIYGCTPLRFAYSNGDLEMMKFLISKGANIKDMAGAECLHFAAGRNLEDMAHYLISVGVPVDKTSIFCAVTNLDFSMVRFLLDEYRKEKNA